MPLAHSVPAVPRAEATDMLDIKDHHDSSQELDKRGDRHHHRRTTTRSTPNVPRKHNSETASTQPRKQHSLRKLHRQRPATAASSPKKHVSTGTRKRSSTAAGAADCRSVVSADDWGNASSGSINHRHHHSGSNARVMELFGETSLREVVGGEQHANEVLASHDKKVENLLKQERVKEGRRNDVKNSLATFLQADHSEDDSITVEDDIIDDDDAEEIFGVEDESLISDEEMTSPVKRSPKRSAFKRHDSVKSSSMSTRKSARMVTRTSRTLDVEEVKSTNSSHSRRSRSRKGVQRIRSKAADEKKSGDNPPSPNQSTRTRGSSRKPSSRMVRRNGADSGDEASVDASSRRRRTRVRSVDPSDDRSVRSATSSHRHGSFSRPRSVDASTRRQRSRSRGVDSSVRLQRRIRSSSKSRDDDDKSVSSKVSTTASNRRGRRPNKGPQTKQNHELETTQATNGLSSPPPSPEHDNHRRGAMSRSMPSLARHLKEEPQRKRGDMDEVSEASSSRFSNCTPQSVLLQFDPTNEDLIQAVNQSEAKTTSETIRHADGTESKFQVSELAGLPTFEKPESSQSLSEHLNASSQSFDVEEEPVVEQAEGDSKPALSARSSLLSSFSNLKLQNPGEAPSEVVRRAPRLSKSTSSALDGSLPPRRSALQPAKSMSFMQRVQNRRAQFDSMVNRSTKALVHQELDDDGSEHD